MNKKIIIINIIVIILSLIFIIVFNMYLMKNYKNKVFNISYDYKWNTIEKTENKIKIINKNNSTIEIFYQKVETKEDMDDTYYNINYEFLNLNNSYKLINNSETQVGKEYYPGYEFLYENKNNQLLYIIIINKNRIIHINYLASTKNFDIDLEYFYEVINNLELR